jgi:predicted small secreted protein
MKKAVGLLVCAAGLVAGCGTVDGQAEPVGSAIKESPFEPCDDIPDDVIRELGFDPATEDRDIMGVKQPGRNICFWNGSAGYLSVESNLHGLDTIQRNPSFLDVRDVDISGQSGLAFSHEGYREGRNCYAATETEAGLLMVSVTVDHVGGDACQAAHSAAVAFLAYTTE